MIWIFFEHRFDGWTDGNGFNSASQNLDLPGYDLIIFHQTFYKTKRNGVYLFNLCYLG